MKFSVSCKTQDVRIRTRPLLESLTFAFKPEKEATLRVLALVPHRGKLRQKETSTPQHHSQCKTHPFDSNDRN